MDEIKMLKGNKEDLPEELVDSNIYVAFTDDEDDYSVIIINGKEWVSKEYIDLKIGEIDELLKQL